MKEITKIYLRASSPLSMVEQAKDIRFADGKRTIAESIAILYSQIETIRVKGGVNYQYDTNEHRKAISELNNNALRYVVGLLEMHKLIALAFVHLGGKLPTVITPNYWHFLELDPNKEQAIGQGLHYFGVRLINLEELSKEHRDTVILHTIECDKSNAGCASTSNNQEGIQSEGAKQSRCAGAHDHRGEREITRAVRAAVDAIEKTLKKGEKITPAKVENYLCDSKGDPSGIVTGYDEQYLHWKNKKGGTSSTKITTLKNIITKIKKSQ